MPNDALRAVDVRKVYRSRRGPTVEALAGVSMRVGRGERVALLGRNGAGKTTFLKIASTLLIPTAGTVEVFGRDATRRPEAVRPLMAVVPQEGKPFFHLTPREQVFTYLRARGVPRSSARERTEEALGQMGLQEIGDRLNITLSGGQRQRTMVATVIATEAPLLFLDEPTIGLDPFARRRVWESLKRLSQGGSTIVLTTHYLDEAEALAERLYIVDRGRVLIEGTAEALKQQSGGTLRVSVTDGARLRPLFEPYGTVVDDGGSLHVITTPERIGAIMEVAVHERVPASVGPVTLEEAFLRVVGHSIEEEES